MEDEAIVGQRCVLMEGSLVEMNSMLGSGAVLPPGRRIPAGEFWARNLARFVRMLTNDEGILGGLRAGFGDSGFVGVGLCHCVLVVWGHDVAEVGSGNKWRGSELT